MGLSIKASPRIKGSFQAKTLLIQNKSIGNRKKWFMIKKNQFITQGIKEQDFSLQRISSSYKRRLRNHKVILDFYGNLSNKLLSQYKVEALRIVQSKKQSLKKGEVLLSLFECRLDVLLYRSSLTSSIYQSRHLIKIGRVLVDGEVCRCINFRMSRLNTCVKVLELSDQKMIKSSVQKASNLIIDAQNKFFIFKGWPNISEINFPFLSNPSVFFV